MKQLKYEQYVNSAPESPQTTEENRILHLDPLYDATMQLDKVIYKNKFLTTKNSARFIIKKDIQKIKFIVYKESKKKHKRLREKAEANL